MALVGAALIAFLCGTPYAILDAPHFLEGLQFDFSHLMEGHGIVLGRGWWYHLTFSLWYGLGAPLLIAGLGGMALLAATSWKKAVMILTFPVLYYVTVGRGFTVFVRYITPVVPFLCITAALVVVWIVRRGSRERSSFQRSWRWSRSRSRCLRCNERSPSIHSIGRTDTRVLAAGMDVRSRSIAASRSVRFRRC